MAFVPAASPHRATSRVRRGQQCAANKKQRPSDAHATVPPWTSRASAGLPMGGGRISCTASGVTVNIPEGNGRVCRGTWRHSRC